MHWTFLDGPPDGTVMLTWQPLNHLGTNFASDGFIWADAEQVYSTEIRGYVSLRSKSLIPVYNGFYVADLTMTRLLKYGCIDVVTIHLTKLSRRTVEGDIV